MYCDNTMLVQPTSRGVLCEVEIIFGFCFVVIDPTMMATERCSGEGETICRVYDMVKC